MKDKSLMMRGLRGQTFPTVILMSLILGILGFALLTLLRQDSKTLVIYSNTMKEQELASIALEHAIYKLGSGSGWNHVPLPGFQYDKEYNTPNGNYTLDIIQGNLFMTTPGNTATRQGLDDYRTVGIKVQVGATGATRAYYAVLKKGGYAGALVSKGVINLPCSVTSINNADVNIYWGDIYSANPATGTCRIPQVKVGNGNEKPQYWLPELFAKADVYTAYNASGCSGSNCSSYSFAAVYSDMSPTAHCHPYSANALAPEVDLDFYRNQAKLRNSYYGPATVGGSPNPYYCGNTVALVTQANMVSVFVNNLQTSDDVLFIDTTDGNPVASTNTYSGVTYVTASTIHIWTDATHQYCTRGSMFVMGPLILEGDNADKPNAAGYSKVTGVAYPNNYYYPQGSGDNYTYASGNPTGSYISNVKHYGFLYMNGQLQIGGLASGSSAITIYGTLYLDQFGSLTETTSPDEGSLWIYFNNTANMFGYMGSGVSILSFNELTYLIPTPMPVYPF
jgi:hypothetical protein